MNMVELPDEFAERVHDTVVQINNWLMETQPSVDTLLPALSVVLGRVIALRAQNETDMAELLKMTINAMVSAAHEEWNHRRAH